MKVKKLSTLHSQLSIPRGFTLIEILTSVSLFAIIGIIFVSMLSFTLRGGKKTDAMENIRQNGDIVLATIVKNVRYAKSIDSPVCAPSVTSSELTITPLVGSKITYSCTAVADSIAANGVSLIDTNTILVQNCSFTCRQPTSTYIPTVTIQFTLSTRDATGLFENKVSIPFQSSVSIRNATR